MKSSSYIYTSALNPTTNLGELANDIAASFYIQVKFIIFHIYLHRFDPCELLIGKFQTLHARFPLFYEFAAYSYITQCILKFYKID